MPATIAQLLNMAVLHNRISNKELKQRMLQETEPRITISFYQYHPIAQPEVFRDELWLGLELLKVFGRIYLATEGINAQISVPQSNMEAFTNFLYSYPWLKGIRLNRAVDDDGKSFWVLKIKVRPKIVADGIQDPGFSMERKGKYLNARQVNQMLQNPETVVLDMRNHYEYEVGHFENALEVPSETFREQLPMAAAMMEGHQDKPIIMYCTGGIRCEKASAYMLHKGFKEVYHVEGGIINYVRQAQEEGLDIKFKGKNFVFDNRLGERITPDVLATCHQCGAPADTHTNCANNGCHLLFIQCPACATRYEGCCSEECQQVMHMPLEEQKKWRAAKGKVQNVFSKSKRRKPQHAANPT